MKAINLPAYLPDIGATDWSQSQMVGVLVGPEECLILEGHHSTR